MTLVVAAGAGSRTGHLVAAIASHRAHQVRSLAALDDPTAVAEAVGRADAIVLVPKPGNAERHTHAAVRKLIAAAQHHAPAAHLLLVSSFAVAHGNAHPLNRVTRSLPGRLAAERALRTSGLAWTIVRPTWLTDDPPGAYAIRLTQDPWADGMLARADLATALVAATEQPLARGTTFALFNEPGEPPRDWAPIFAAASDPQADAA